MIIKNPGITRGTIFELDSMHYRYTTLVTIFFMFFCEILGFCFKMNELVTMNKMSEISVKYAIILIKKYGEVRTSVVSIRYLFLFVTHIRPVGQRVCNFQRQKNVRLLTPLNRMNCHVFYRRCIDYRLLKFMKYSFFMNSTGQISHVHCTVQHIFYHFSSPRRYRSYQTVTVGGTLELDWPQRF